MRHSETQSLKREKEANAFACLLLMPPGAFEEAITIAEQKWKLHGDELIIHLAKTFKVPLFAVCMRCQLLSNSKF